jgi:hypothetical protein
MGPNHPRLTTPLLTPRCYQPAGLGLNHQLRIIYNLDADRIPKDKAKPSPELELPLNVYPMIGTGARGWFRD